MAFSRTYAAFPLAMLEEAPQVERGNKIYLPPSALESLMNSNVEFPYYFKLTNVTKGRSTHCGVLQFTAPENRIFMPFWMMTDLQLEIGKLARLEIVNVVKGSRVQLQPLSIDFMDIPPEDHLDFLLR